MNKKALIVVVTVLIIVAGVWFFVHSKEQVSQDAWSHYSSPELGVSFDYPSTWKLTKSTTGHSMVTIDIEGNGGYHAEFTNAGKDIPTGPDTISTKETVSGHGTTLYRDKGQPGVLASISYCPDVGIVLTSTSGSREIIDKIIASITCLR